MNPLKAEKIFSLMKTYGVEYFKHEDLEIKMSVNVAKTETPKIQAPTQKVAEIPPQQAIPIVDPKIPHHVNEVANLLRLSDVDLVDKLFPDYTQPPKAEGE